MQSPYVRLKTLYCTGLDTNTFPDHRRALARAAAEALRGRLAPAPGPALAEEIEATVGGYLHGITLGDFQSALQAHGAEAVARHKRIEATLEADRTASADGARSPTARGADFGRSLRRHAAKSGRSAVKTPAIDALRVLAVLVQADSRPAAEAIRGAAWFPLR